MQLVRVAAVAAVAVLATAVLASPAHAAPPPASGCADVELVVTRGTTEQDVVGALGGLARSITSAASQTVSTYGVPYPATADWVNSANQGIALLAAHLRDQSAKCPGQRFVLLGYSQGAWVIGDALAGGGGGVTPAVPASLGAKIDAIVLWGDPRFRGSEPFNSGDYSASLNGLIPREAGALSSYASRIRSYCYADDTICQSGASGSGHIRYPSAAVSDGSTFVVSKLTPATPPTTTPPPTSSPAPSPTPTTPSSTAPWDAWFQWLWDLFF